jgi:hypothetical protein
VLHGYRGITGQAVAQIQTCSWPRMGEPGLTRIRKEDENFTPGCLTSLLKPMLVKLIMQVALVNKLKNRIKQFSML